MNIHDRAKEFCEAAFGPLGVEVPPYTSIIAELLEGAVTAERERIAKLVDDFHWTLPLYTTKEVNEASDDAAESVKDQIATAIRST